MSNRRGFLRNLASLPVWGSLGFGTSSFAAAPKRDYFKELGVKPFINAAGTFTTLTASLMNPEAVEAMQYASKVFVRLDHLQDAVGKRIAELTGAEAAMVTSGAAGAMTIGTAGCITGENREFIQRLPDTTGMKNEVIIQKAHRYGYEHAVRSAGTKLVEVETVEDLARAVNPRTAMMLFYNNNDPVGQIHAEEFARLGKKHNVPTFNDASADVPPVGNLTKYVKLGFDLVAISGGKGICGPQSAGMLLGRKDLIQAAKLNTSPNSDSLTRGMKVNKEEMLGMLVALENFIHRDHEAVQREWDRRVRVIQDSVAKLPTIKSEVFVPEIANHTPHLKFTWDTSRIKITVPEVMKQLQEGAPAIESTPGSSDALTFTVWMLQPGEEKIVARRLSEILKSAV